MKSLKTLKIATAATALLSAHFAYSVSLQDLTHGYDVFVKEDATLNAAHVEGSIAVGGALKLEGNQSEFGRRAIESDYLVLANSVVLNSDGQYVGGSPSPYQTRVGSLTGDQSISGSSLRDSVTGKEIKFGALGGAVEQPIDANFFNTSFNQLSGLSDDLAGLAPTNSVGDYISGQNLELKFGETAGVKVVNTTWSSFASISNLVGSGVALAGEVFVINVDLTGIGSNNFVPGGFNNNLSLNGEPVADYSDWVLWNFFANDGSSLNLNKGWSGSILAPDLDVTNTSNNVEGMIVAKSLVYTGGEMHVDRFDHEFPSSKVADSGSTAFFALLTLPVFFALRRRMK